ncbi:hypothetical protein D5086_022545 [Populus alba]|uniref:Uncharacterized protein n=1 Tax=Populus alba TaxID=43335 RepID=A0ACC4BG09_POPAL
MDISFFSSYHIFSGLDWTGPCDPPEADLLTLSPSSGKSMTSVAQQSHSYCEEHGLEAELIFARSRPFSGLRELVQFRIGAMGGSIAAGTWEYLSHNSKQFTF